MGTQIGDVGGEARTRRGGSVFRVIVLNSRASAKKLGVRKVAIGCVAPRDREGTQRALQQVPYGSGIKMIKSHATRNESHRTQMSKVAQSCRKLHSYACAANCTYGTFLYILAHSCTVLYILVHS
jgi:hypothetical protein